MNDVTKSRILFLVQLMSQFLSLKHNQKKLKLLKLHDQNQKN